MATLVLIPGAGTDLASTTRRSRRWARWATAAWRRRCRSAMRTRRPAIFADAVVGALPADGEFIVVAQSLGAFAGTLAVARAPVAQLILVAPMIPRPGESRRMVGEHRPRGGDRRPARASRADEPWVPTRSPRSSSTTSLRASRDNKVYQGAPEPACSPSPGPSRAGLTCRRTCLRRPRIGSFRSEFQRRVARERLGLEIDEIPGGHLPMLSRPRELAKSLIELAHPRQAAC